MDTTEQEKIEATAEPAYPDIADRLEELRWLAETRRKDPVKEALYADLRDELAAYLLKNGPRYFLDAQGNKRYAYAVRPEPLVVEVEKLEELAANGAITYELLDQVAPPVRKVNADAFRQAVHLGKFTGAQFLYVAHKEMDTAYVKYVEPDD